MSPIRHVKDGMHENQLSKAVLLSAVDALQRSCPARVGYFPAYEIMMDELRDYRFYADDMLHPSDAAVAYIWQRFVETMMKPETVREMACCEQLYRDLNHRPLHPESEAYRLFREGVEERYRQMTERYPWLESDLKK
ncbi:MAG: GSCFA domain-containing protein [Paludibacteraceae bacterium]|nr:GSCFA domain-containing protein [Paludibacteraceae bacterium]